MAEKQGSGNKQTYPDLPRLDVCEKWHMIADIGTRRVSDLDVVGQDLV